MFNISYNLNKKTDITVIFADSDFNNFKKSNFFSKSELNCINLFKSDFLNNEFIKFDLFEKNKKKNITDI